MKRAGRPRRALIARLCPPGERIVDIGADHGHVAHAVGAIATERAPHRRGRPDVPWVVADGLRPFRALDVAIIAGMGAHTIAGILAEAPPLGSAILHAPDDPPTLRCWLAAHGWRIDAEGLAPEARRFAEVIRAVPGRETATGTRLALGPRLLEGDDPHLGAHLRQLHGHYDGLVRAIGDHDPTKRDQARARRDLAASVIQRRGLP